MRKKKEGIRQPILTPGEAWHLGRMDAVKEMKLRLPRIDTQSEEVLSSIVESASAGYGKSARQYPPQHAPPEVMFDSYLDMPVVLRLQELTPGWGKIEFDPGKSGKPISLATPFRYVDVDSLPAGTRLIPMQDPRHATLAAVVDVLDSFRNALANARVATGPKEAAGRIWDIILVQLQAARYATMSLSVDEYRNWSHETWGPCDVLSIPKMIGDAASTARAQQALALQACAAWMDATNDVCSQDAEHFDALQSKVDDAIIALGTLLESSNRIAVGEEWEQNDVMTVMRHGKGQIPLLAVIPKDKSAEVVARLIKEAEE